MPAPDLSLVAERRAHEAPVPADARAPVGPAGSGKPGAYPETVRVTKAPALTAREERVRRLLVREIETLNKRLKLSKTWAEKREREHLARLDVAFLDREIAKMERQQAQQWHVAVLLSIPIVILGVAFWAARNDPDFTPVHDWINVATFVFAVGVSVWGYVQGRDALRRKRYLYEALRALSDADEIDVVLDRATRHADALIEAIVARELAAEQRYPARLALDDAPPSADARPRTRART